MSDVNGLVAFLRARYGMAAQGAAALPHAIGNFQSLWSPDRLLADVDSKLRIVARLSDVIAKRLPDEDLPRSFARAAQDDARHMLRLLALPYADHKDYREEWKP